MANSPPRFWQRLFGTRQADKPPIIVVSGLPRSGTSVMMQMLVAGGIEALTDEVRQADTDNPKGYFEFARVKQLAADTAWLNHAHGKAVKIITALLPHLPSDHTYRIILMHRDIQEVLASQQAMLDRQGQSREGSNDAEMGRLMTAHFKTTKTWLNQQPNMTVLDISHAELMTHPLGCAQTIQPFIGQPMHLEQMAATVDASLYRNRSQ